MLFCAKAYAIKMRHHLSAPHAYRNALICFVGELLAYTITKQYIPYYLHSILCLGWGLAGAYFFYVGLSNGTISPKIFPQKDAQPSYLLWGMTLLAVIGAGITFGKAWHKFYDYAKTSDVIHQACTLAQRFFEREKVYQTIHYSGYDLEPTYLPFTWIPFLLTHLLNIDPRLICIFLWGGIMAWGLWWRYRQELSVNQLSFFSLLFALIIALFSQYNPEDVSVTVELLHAFYYGLLIYGLATQQLWIIGLALVLILLSRYGLVLWLPVPALLYFIYESRRKTLLLFAGVFAGVFLFYVLPFLVWEHDFSAFLRGFQYYNQAAVGEWKPHTWQQPTDPPYHLFRGIGLAGWAYRLLGGSLEEKIATFKLLQYVLAFGSVVVGGWLVVKALKKGMNLTWGMIWSLKVYLLFFYQFILIPYTYLFLVPITVSGLMLLFSTKNAK